MRQFGKLGKLEARRPAGLADMVAYIAETLPDPPETVDFTVGVDVFEMASNDKYGCCTIASAAHMDKSWSAQTKENYIYPGDTIVDSTYFALTGGADNGLVEADVLSAWKNTGLFGHKIVAYAPVNISDIKTLKSALNLFGGLYVGVQLPAISQTQFANGQPWILTGNKAIDNNIIGGHAIPLLGYDAQDNFITVTWGAKQLLSLNWYKANCDEAWAVISYEFSTDLNINISALEKDLTLTDI